jgi:hypothetical protein
LNIEPTILNNVGYYRADSILIAPEGYFTNEDASSEGLGDRFLGGRIFQIDDSPGRIMRVLSRLNRLINMRAFDNNTP